MIYAIQIWGATFDCFTNKIVTLQKKVVRMMTFTVTFFSENGPPHSGPLFKKLNILKFNDIFKLRLSQFIYDSVHGFAPNQFKTWFVFVRELYSYNTRSNTNDNAERQDQYL